MTLQKQKLAKCGYNVIESQPKIGFHRKIFAFGRDTSFDMVRGLLIDPEGRFEPKQLGKLTIPREMYMHARESIVMHRGQMFSYQTMLRVLNYLVL